jgi:hypothetical protein
MAALYEILSIKREFFFKRNGLCDIHTLLKAVKRMLPYFPYFLSDLGSFGVGDIHTFKVRAVQNIISIKALPVLSTYHTTRASYTDTVS